MRFAEFEALILANKEWFAAHLNQYSWNKKLNKEWDWLDNQSDRDLTFHGYNIELAHFLGEPNFDSESRIPVFSVRKNNKLILYFTIDSLHYDSYEGYCLDYDWDDDIWEVEQKEITIKIWDIK